MSIRYKRYKNNLLRQIVEKRYCYFYLVPTFVLLAVFFYYPAINAFVSSFCYWSAYGERSFVGLENFKRVFSDYVIVEGTKNLIKLLSFSLIVSTVMPLLAAEAIFNISNQKAKFWYRWFLVVPMVIPVVVILLIWSFIYHPEVGLLNWLLRFIGYPQLQRTWLQDPDVALYCIMFIGFPWVSGVSVLIYLAGLDNIGNEVIDASLIDGATRLRRIVSIDIPMILGQIKLLIILGIIGGMQGFGIQLILTQGGPCYATMVPGLWMYQQAINFDNLGYACAIATIMFLVILLITYLNMKYIKSSVEYKT